MNNILRSLFNFQGKRFTIQCGYMQYEYWNFANKNIHLLSTGQRCHTDDLTGVDYSILIPMWAPPYPLRNLPFLSNLIDGASRLISWRLKINNSHVCNVFCNASWHCKYIWIKEILRIWSSFTTRASLNTIDQHLSVCTVNKFSL